MTGPWPGRRESAGMAQQTPRPPSTTGGAHTLPCIRSGAAATVVRRHSVGLAAADTREREESEPMTGTWPGRYSSSVVTRPGARRAETAQRKKVARRANTGLPIVDMESKSHVHEQDDSPSRSYGRTLSRSPERRRGAAGCLGPAATSSGSAPAMSTLSWRTFKPSGPRSASRSSSDARLRTEERWRSQSPHGESDQSRLAAA